MIKVIYGPKGTGKTKALVDTANKLAHGAYGTVVFIDRSKQLLYSLKHEIRFVDVSDFPTLGADGFFGFICGILTQNYDIEGIFIDGLNKITGLELGELEPLFKKLEKLSKDRENVIFYLTINGVTEEVPSFLSKYSE